MTRVERAKHLRISSRSQPIFAIATLAPPLMDCVYLCDQMGISEAYNGYVGLPAEPGTSDMKNVKIQVSAKEAKRIG